MLIDLNDARRRINGFIAEVSDKQRLRRLDTDHLEVEAVFAHDKTRQRTSATVLLRSLSSLADGVRSSAVAMMRWPMSKMLNRLSMA